MSTPGQKDHTGARLTCHALDRFVERFGVEPSQAEATLRDVLRQTRRLGRNAENRAIAVLALHRSKILVAIFQGDTCTTVLTWPQFEPRMKEFGRVRLPRKRGRMLRRLQTEPQSSDPAT